MNRFIYYVLSPFTVIISLSFWFMLFVLRGSLIVWFPGYGRWPSNAHQLHFINQQKLIDFVSRCLFIHFIVAPAKREEPPLNQSIKFICLLWIKVEWLAVCAASKTNWMPKEAEWNLMELNGMSWFRGRGALAPITSNWKRNEASQQTTNSLALQIKDIWFALRLFCLFVEM